MATDKIRVLFVCVHNSARSQMAEAFLTQYGAGRFQAESAGFEPTRLNPLAIEAMKEEGIDISSKQAKKVFDYVRSGKLFHYVISVCDDAAAQKCPVFPGVTKRLHWSFEDPSSLTGSDEEKMAKIRDIRDRIKSRVLEFIKSPSYYVQ
jgi:arsenate reductase (thioredoxin)